MGFYVIIPSAWLICGVCCAFIASNKNRSGVGWFFLGVLFGIIVLFVVLFINEIEYEQDDAEDSDLIYICEKCGNQVIVSQKDLKNIDIVVCVNCENEIKIKKEQEKKEKVKSITCPGCGEDLYFEKKQNQSIECPFCNTKIKLK